MFGIFHCAPVGGIRSVKIVRSMVTSRTSTNLTVLLLPNQPTTTAIFVIESIEYHFEWTALFSLLIFGVNWSCNNNKQKSTTNVIEDWSGKHKWNAANWQLDDMSPFRPYKNIQRNIRKQSRLWWEDTTAAKQRWSSATHELAPRCCSLQKRIK